MELSQKETEHPNVTVAVMAGGKSSRMGTDKAFVPVLGKPMIEHVLEQVHGLSNETIILTNEPNSYSYLNIAMYGDFYTDRGPLGGLHAALYHASHPSVLVVACDMPWLNRTLLNFLVSLRNLADVIVPRWLEHPEPLHAVYNKTCLAAIENNIRQDRLKTISFYDQVNVKYVSREEIAQFDPDGRSFSNINTPGELTAANKAKESKY